MEVDEIQNQGCNKYARISNGNSRFESNKIEEDGGGRSSSGVDVGRLCGWPSSRIVRVSRASGGKDRHSKVWTSKGLRDRRVRLSVNTAIQFYDLQDRLGYDQPSKAVEWLLKAAATSISELPSLNGFPDAQQMDELEAEQQQQQQHLSKSACSSTSETSKGSGGLSLSRSENRVKARERARERAAEKDKDKDKDKETDIHRVPHNSSSFTELLTGGMNHNNNNTSSNKSPFDYFPSTSGFQTQISSPMFSITGDHHHQELQHFPFAMSEVATHNNNEYNLNFSISSSSSSGLAGYNRGGTLQSNSSTLPHFQRYSSPVEGSQSFFNNNTMSAYDARLQLFYGDAHGNLHSDHKGKGTKN